MNSREKLIAELSKDLAVVKPVANINLSAYVWFFISFCYVVIVINSMGPIRTGALRQLVSEPRFFLEMALGLVAIILITLSAFRDAIPARLSNKFLVTTLIMLLLWLGQYFWGLFSPALEPSSIGKRNFCQYETLLFSLPPMLVAFYLLQRWYALKLLRTAALMSLAAGMLPAWYMQLACMYEPMHILSFHILPGVFVIVIGLGMVWSWRQYFQA